MIPIGIKEKFERYRKWFETLLIEEFLELPAAYQERFIKCVEKFLEDCKKIHGESKIIKEKTVELTVTKIIPDNESFTVYCTIPKVENNVKIHTSKPVLAGTRFHSTVYSLDETTWYSSKKELLTKETCL